MAKLMKRFAGSFGDANIPEQFVKTAIVPREPISLYWREIAEGNMTVEIWNTNESKYVVVQGDFSVGQWTAQAVSLVKEFEKLTEAIEFVRASYVFKDGGSTENDKPEEEPVVEEPKEEPVKESSFKKTLRKIRGC